MKILKEKDLPAHLKSVPPPPPAPKTDPTAEAIDRLGHMLAKQQQVQVQALAQQVAALAARPMPQPSKQWRFVVARNQDGLIEEIVADRTA